MPSATLGIGKARPKEAGLRISLLGPAEVLVGGQPIRGLYSRKGLWLFALLALRQGKEVNRTWLAAMLWPDADESLGLYYLRRELSALRKGLGAEARRLESPTSKLLLLDLQDAEYDVRDFDKSSSAQDEQALELAAQIHRGPLLEGCHEEWVDAERQSREMAWLGVLEELAERALARGDPRSAILMLRKAVQKDPLRESAQRSLIRAFAMDGDLAAALQAFRELRMLLFRELHAEPDPETTSLIARIRAEARQKAIRDSEVSESGQAEIGGTLPQPLTSLVGRAAELRGIEEKLASSRLVTLIGTGGVGKTRLALQAAECLKERFGDGARFVDLAPMVESGLVSQGVAAALGIREESDKTIEDALCESLWSRQILIVLDNCEQVVEGVASIVHKLLQTCTGVKVLATSRQPLRIAGEAALRVPSLDMPPIPDDGAGLGRIENVSALLEYEAIRLFVERARQASGEFELDPNNSEDIVQICRKLDGIPLAIELAAARVRSLTVREIAERLSESFGMLTGGSRAAMPRHQTLQAAIAWSIDPLESHERALLERLSVFSGGCFLDAVESICGFADEPRELILDRLGELVDKSLVNQHQKDGKSWYRLLETIREQAGQSLSENGRQSLRETHAEFYLGLVEKYHVEAETAAYAAWGRRFDAELDNLRLAMDYWIGAARADQALRMPMMLHRYWSDRGLQEEGRRWLSRARELDGASPKNRASALKTLGLLMFGQKEFEATRAAFEESYLLHEELGDHAEAASIVNSLGNVALQSGNYEEARTCFERALAFNSKLGLPLCQGMNLGNLGHLAQDLGEYEPAISYFEKGLALIREVRAERIVPGFLAGLGATLRRFGESEKAGEALREGLAIAREQGGLYWQATLLINLGALAISQGDLEDAGIYLAHSLAILRRTGDRLEAAFALETWAKLLFEEGNPERAAWLVGGARGLRGAAHAPMAPCDVEPFEQLVAALRERLGDSRFAAAEAKGRVESFENIIAFALSADSEPPGAGAAKAVGAR